ncbi:MAG TPA: hypothetical protein VFY51_03825 [Pyrinomonadaceae bacterium]|nr:hypothetical protein [Pyrinomonadaceae bacterium]
MWRIEKPELRPAKLDFTSSAQGVREVTQLFADGVQLINAVELVYRDSDEMQVLICEACGIDHCKSGDWVRVRRSGSMVLMLPAFDFVWAERDEDRIEYRPPKYLSERGVAYFDRSTYEGLHAQNPQFPAFETIRRLNMREAALLFHWTAPAQVLGVPPEIRVNDKIIVGASEGAPADHTRHLEKLLHDSYVDESNAILRPLKDSDRVISIYLQVSEFIDWKAVVIDGDDHRLVVDSSFVIVICARAAADS